MKFVNSVVNALILTGARSATKFVSPTEVIRVTRPMSKKRKRPVHSTKADRTQHFVLTIGRPNYRERQFIKDCKAAGVTFPVRNIRLRGFPTARRGK